MKTAKRLLVLLLVVTTVASARKRDPLTEAEADQLREARLEPYKRLKLFIKFTQTRFDSIDQMRADPKKADGRGKQVHDLLEDITALLDEINNKYLAQLDDQKYPVFATCGNCHQGRSGPPSFEAASSPTQNLRSGGG